MKHPIQPTQDCNGVIRFKQNTIVNYLLDNGGIDMNHLARQKFDRDEWVQFAQLIGYSVSGWGGLSYVSDEDYAAAQAKMESPEDSDDKIRIKGLEMENKMLKDHLRDIIGITQEIDIERF